MERTKFTYTFVFAPFYFSELIYKIYKYPFFTISFDKSLFDNFEKYSNEFYYNNLGSETEKTATRCYQEGWTA